MYIEKEIVKRILSGVCPELEFYEFHSQLTIIVPREKLKDVCLVLRDSEASQFDLLLDVTAIDWNKRGARFETVYFLYSNPLKKRLRIKVPVDGKNPHCPSVIDIWESADWYERETYDMYGVVFDGHPHLRRFYMPEDFVDPETGEPLHPLRKDFPLMGVPGSLPLPPYPEKYGNPM
ncbi:MAG: NADH-quinone oxidoreductase subunit C [Chloroflexota bacterium]